MGHSRSVPSDGQSVSAGSGAIRSVPNVSLGGIRLGVRDDLRPDTSRSGRPLGEEGTDERPQRIGALHDLCMAGGGKDGEPAVGEEVEHLAGMIEADEIAVADHEKGGSGDRPDLQNRLRVVATARDGRSATLSPWHQLGECSTSHAL